MKKIDEPMLEALFQLSRFELKDEERQFWCDDLNHWVEFFNLEDYQSPDNHYRPPCAGNQDLLRADHIEPSLEVKQIKSFCPRFLDGFIALPKKGEREEF